MFDFVSSFSGPYWSGVATAITIGSLLVATFRLGKRRNQKIFYEILDSALIKQTEVGGIELLISAEGKCGKALHRRSVFIYNGTRKALDGRDFVGNPFMMERSEGAIYAIKNVSTASASEYDLIEEDQRIAVKNLALPADSCIIIDVFHDGCVNGPLISHPREGDLLKRYTITGEIIDIKLIPLLLGVLVAPLGLLYLLIGYVGRLFELVPQSFSLLVFIFVMVLVVGTLLALMQVTLDKVLSLSKGRLFRRPAEVDFINYMNLRADLHSSSKPERV